DTDALRIDAPLFGFAANKANSPLRILKGAARRLSFGFIRAARDPVLENDSSDTDGIEPGRDFLSFQLPIKIPVPASRTNEHGCSGFLVFGRPEHSARSVGYACEICR